MQSDLLVHVRHKKQLWLPGYRIPSNRGTVVGQFFSPEWGPSPTSRRSEPSPPSLLVGEQSYRSLLRYDTVERADIEKSKSNVAVNGHEYVDLRILLLSSVKSYKFWFAHRELFHRPPPAVAQPTDILFTTGTIWPGSSCYNRCWPSYSDARNSWQGPLAIMLGHSYAVNKLAWLPHLLNMLLTAIYDMTGHVWNDQLEVPVNYGVDLLRMIQSVQLQARNFEGWNNTRNLLPVSTGVYL